MTYDFEDIVDQLERRIDKAADVLQKRQNESIIGSVLGIIISGPFILKLIGKFLLPVEKFLRQNKGNQKLVMDSVIEFAEHMHHKLEQPLMKLASTFTKDTATQQKFTDAFMAGLLAILIVDGGISSIKSLQNLQMDKSLLYTAKTSIKGAELSAKLASLGIFIKSVLKSV